MAIGKMMTKDKRKSRMEAKKDKSKKKVDNKKDKSKGRSKTPADEYSD